MPRRDVDPKLRTYFQAQLDDIQEKREALEAEEEHLIAVNLKFIADDWNKLYPEGSEQREYRGGKPMVADDLVMPLTQECEADDGLEHHTPVSPVGFCVYDDVEDPANDSCIYCGQPRTRK